MSSTICIYMDFEGGDHLHGRLGLRAAVWLQAKVRECGHELQFRLNGLLCVMKALLKTGCIRKCGAI